MRTRLMRSKATLLFVAFAALLLAVGGTALALTSDTNGTTAPAPTIQSDKDDYRPGETVTLTGSNWQPGESVHINVNDDVGQTWSYDSNPDVQADANGNISHTFNLPNSFVATYKVTATGAQSGTATTTFTDGNIGVTSSPVATGASQVLFDLKYTQHNRATNQSPDNGNCSTTAADDPQATQVVGSTTNGSGKNNFQKGVPASSSIRLEAAQNANQPTGWTFKEWTGPAGSFTVIDNNPRVICATGNFTGSRDLVAVYQGPQAPVLGAIGNKSVNEGSQLSFTANATDANGDTITYSLANGTGCTGSESCTVPSGATINSTTGAFSWTPSEAQGPGTYKLKVVASDGSLSDDEQITITVAEVNQAPVLASIGNKSVNEGQQLSFNASATDADVPANTITYSLVAGDNCASGETCTVPSGATINASTGAFSWTPSFTDAGTYKLKVKATDNGTPNLSDDEQITITVNNVNRAPSVGNITGDSTAIEGESKTYNVTASDDDGDTLTYAWTVKSGAATITSGAATATATVNFLDGPGSVNLQVVVSDGQGGQVTKNLDANLISVTNVDPDITSFTSTPYFFGPLSFLGNTPTASKFSAAWTDPGADTWKADLTYQDGSPLTQQLLGLTTRSFSNVGHTFASAGCKSTQLNVSDDDLGSDTATTTTEVGTAAFMPPMTNQPVTDKLRNGQVLPVKVKFTDCNGAPLTNLTPAIRLVQGDQTPSADDSTATITPGAVGATADTMGIMRSNGDGSYIYNMSVNITLNKDYTVVVYPYGLNDPRRLGHVIIATK